MVTSHYYGNQLLLCYQYPGFGYTVCAPPSNSEVKDGWVSWKSCCYGNGYYIRIE